MPQFAVGFVVNETAGIKRFGECVIVAAETDEAALAQYVETERLSKTLNLSPELWTEEFFEDEFFLRVNLRDPRRCEVFYCLGPDPFGALVSLVQTGQISRSMIKEHGGFMIGQWYRRPNLKVPSPRSAVTINTDRRTS